MLVTAVIVGLVASSALVIGALLGAFWRPPRILLAVLLGFASGALIIAVAFELFEKAVTTAGIAMAGGSLLAGGVVFVVATSLLDRYATSTSGLYMQASITLDGVPENLAMGVALIGASFTGILSLVIAIFFSNFPEALGGAVGMRDGGRSRRFVVANWSATALLLTGMVLVGNLAFAALGPTALAAVRAFAGGAVLASLAEALMPQAYGQASKSAALATAAGFLLTFVVTH